VKSLEIYYKHNNNNNNNCYYYYYYIQAMCIQGSVDISKAAKESGLNNDFAEKMSTLGTGGKHRGNLERDFLRDAKTRLGVPFDVCMVPNIVKDSLNITKDLEIGVLLPYEVAHLVYAYNRPKFGELFDKTRIIKYWQRAIVDDLQWFREHPMYETIRSSDTAGLSKYLPLHIFGDDGTLKKSRAMAVITWFSAVYTSLNAVESRVPFYTLPRHILVPDYTENELQRVLVWSFSIWLTGVFPTCDWKGNPWPRNSLRALLGERREQIAGGHIGVYTATICDQLWGKQHYRLEHNWAAANVCGRCDAINGAGPKNFLNVDGFVLRCCSEYLTSDAGLSSPLAEMPGFGLYSLVGEAMHAGPLGVLLDVAAYNLIDLCFAGIFGDFGEVTTWADRLQFQLNAAFVVFSAWTKREVQQHTIRKFGRRGFSMENLTSWPEFKGKAHNTLVLIRWLERAMFEVKDHLHLGVLKSQVLWGWVEWFSVCLAADPDFLEPDEIARLAVATNLCILGHKRLASDCEAAGVWRWKARPKIHIFYHVLQDVSETRRNPRAWWSFKDEECMGRLARIACCVHAVTVANRTLQRWCVQFYNSD
jgi:hypothetical protein